MSLSFWKVGDTGALAADAGTAGTYVSRQLGLEARKIRARNAMDVMADPAKAVLAYNEELDKLEALAGEKFLDYQKKAFALGYSEDMAKNYATKRAADWLESEMELLDYAKPFASNTGLLINAKLGAPLIGQGLQVAADSTIPVDAQQRIPVHGRAAPAASAQRRKAKKTKKARK